MTKALVIVAAAFVFTNSCLSQAITPFIVHATGGSYANSAQNFYVDWNVGEMTLTNTIQYGSGNSLVVITNGLLQPEKAPDINLHTHVAPVGVLTTTDVKVYPNPTADKVIVQLAIDGDQNIELVLYNSVGQQVYMKQLSPETSIWTEEIKMHNFAQGTYLLFVKMTSGEKTRLGTFKIIKTN